MTNSTDDYQNMYLAVTGMLLVVIICVAMIRLVQRFAPDSHGHSHGTGKGQHMHCGTNDQKKKKQSSRRGTEKKQQ